MTRKVVILTLILFAVVAAGGFYIFRLLKRRAAASSAVSERLARTRLTEAALQPPGAAASNVQLYFPSFPDGKLVSETRSIKLAATDTDRIRQVLLALIEGSHQGRSPALPPSTTIRGVFLTADGAAYIDFSGKSLAAFDSGIESETLSIYSIVDSLAANVPDVKQVKFLVDGQEVETLDGHVNLTGFFVPDLSLIESGP